MGRDRRRQLGELGVDERSGPALPQLVVTVDPRSEDPRPPELLVPLGERDADRGIADDRRRRGPCPSTAAPARRARRGSLRPPRRRRRRAARAAAAGRRSARRSARSRSASDASTGRISSAMRLNLPSARQTAVATVATGTRDRILAVAAERFGTRGVDAVSLDEIAAEVGVRKQTVLYWFASKEELVDAVLEATATEIAVVIDAAVRVAPDDPLARVDAVVRAVVPPRRAPAGAPRPRARAEPAAGPAGGSPAPARRPADRPGRGVPRRRDGRRPPAAR